MSSQHITAISIEGLECSSDVISTLEKHAANMTDLYKEINMKDLGGRQRGEQLREDLQDSREFHHVVQGQKEDCEVHEGSGRVRCKVSSVSKRIWQFWSLGPWGKARCHDTMEAEKSAHMRVLSSILGSSSFYMGSLPPGGDKGVSRRDNPRHLACKTPVITHEFSLTFHALSWTGTHV